MKYLICVCAVAAMGVSVWASAPQFRSRVDLVHLDVSVLDRDRRPVLDLTPDDFTVFENGKPQPVSAFVPIVIRPPESASAAWVRDVPSDVRDNAEVRERRLFVITIDDATIENDPKALKSVREIGRQVIDRLGPADLASVVFTRDNRHAQDFTSDRARLLAAVDSVTAGFRGMSDVGGSDDLWYLYSVGALERAVDFLADLPERRRAIIYIGQGLPFDISIAGAPVAATPTQTAGAISDAALQMRVKDQMTDLFDRATRSNVTIYPIDACGLRQPPLPPGGPRPKIPPTCVLGVEVDFLENLATSTGGRAVVNANDFTPGVTAVFDENASYYLLGYQSTDPARDGRFRRIEVKVNRPDVEVRTRSGYDAPREDPEGSVRPTPSPVGTAIAGVLPVSDLPMQVTAAPFGVAGQADASVAIVVGFRQPIRQSPERVIENVDLQVTAFNADGRSFGTIRQRADVTVRSGAEGHAEYEVFTTIALKPGRYQLRVAANVGSLATAGSVFYDLDVPDFQALPVSFSGLMLSAEPRPAFAPKEALAALIPVVPSSRRVFAPTHKVQVFGRVYQSGRAAALSVRMQVRDARDAVVLERQQAVSAGRFGKTKSADLTFDVPIADLPQGAYLLTLETSVGTAAARRDVRFHVAR
jgi:VWFA-related protein